MADGFRPPRGGPKLPIDATPIRIAGVVHTRMSKFGVKIRIWPRKRPGAPTPAQARARADFQQMVELVKQVPAWDRVAATTIAHGSGWTWRDVLSKCVTGRFWEIDGLEASAVPFILDALSSTEGAILYRGPDGWVGLVPAANGDVLSLASGIPIWVDPTSLGVGITELHGDIAAGPGTGDVVATLTPTGITAGSYQSANVTVGTDGRIHGISGGSIATSSVVGLVKPDNSSVTVDGAGRLSAPYQSPPTATNLVLGIVKPDAVTVTIDGTGKLTAPYQSPPTATNLVLGIVKPDNTTITVNGSGVLSVPSTGGALALVSTKVAASSASLSWTGLTGGAQNAIYKLVISQLVPATSGADLWLRLGTGTGPTWSATNYNYTGKYHGAAGADGSINAENAAQLPLFGSANSGGFVNLEILISGTAFQMTASGRSSDGHWYWQSVAGQWYAGTAFTGIELLMSSGNIASGQASLYTLQN